MDYYLRPLLFALSAVCIVPAVITQIIFCACGEKSPEKRFGKRLFLGTFLNLCGNGLLGYGLLSWRFHTRRPWLKLWQIVRLQGSYQDIGTWAAVLGICVLGGIAGGWILHRLLFRDAKVSGRGKRMILLIAILCLVPVLGGRAVSYQSIQQLNIQEVYRKTSPSEENALVMSGVDWDLEEVSAVTLRNPGMLDCVVSDLWASESEDHLREIRFENCLIPAQGTLSLMMDYDHGMEIRRNGGTTIYISAADSVIDSVKLPALEEEESYVRLSAGEDGWVVMVRGRVKAPYVEGPSFSETGGMYPKDFLLELSAPEGLSVYYTLDCSDPTTASARYEEPILITDRSGEENIWSSRMDVAASFTTDSSRFSVPDSPVDKCTVVRAICADEAGNVSGIVTQCYFVGYQDRKGYDGLRIVSIVTDPVNLFDDEFGIYVLGNIFRDQFDPATDKASHWWPANYHQKGRNWERAADIQFYDTDNTLLLSKKIGIRIKGEASAGLLPKGLNLYARKEYDSAPAFPIDFFGTGYLAKRLALSGGGNDVYTKARDWLMSRLAGELDVPMYHYEPCQVFLDGEYWGVYMLEECFDSEYFSDRYNVMKDSVVIIKKGKLKRGISADLQDYRDMVAFFEETDMSVPENYQRAEELIDIENCLTYFALEIYCGNTDWRERGNIALWRVNTPQDNSYGDGRWRWALYDVNHSSAFSLWNLDYVAEAMEKHTVFRSLMGNDEFQRRFYETMKMLAEEIFIPEKTGVAIREYEEMMKPALDLDHQRFYNEDMNLGRIDEYQFFFKERKEQVLQECERMLQQ